MADSEPIRQSFFNWFLSALGWQYAILLPSAGLICFLFALILVMRGKGPMAAAGLVLIVHIPFFIGLFAAFQGLMTSFIVIAASPSSPKPSELAAGYSMALAAPMIGMILMVPGYATAVLGAIVRSFHSEAASGSSQLSP